MNAIEKLKAAVSMAAVKKTILLPNGEEFEFYTTPMSLGDRAKCQRMAKSDNTSEFGLQLLVTKARDINGELLFHSGNIAELKKELPAHLVEKLIIEIVGDYLNDDEADEVQEDLSTKSTSKTTKKRKPVVS